MRPVLLIISRKLKAIVALCYILYRPALWTALSPIWQERMTKVHKGTMNECSFPNERMMESEMDLVEPFTVIIGQGSLHREGCILFFLSGLLRWR